MNIFYLDSDVKKCAAYHYDGHIVKMILESTQMLCTVLHQCGVAAPYRPTHKQHPCVIWTGASLDNWLWLKLLTIELNKVYQFRFNRQTPHQSFVVATALPLPPLPLLGLTQRPLVMPDPYKIPGNPVESYRHFYAVGKKHLRKYTKSVPPDWLNK